VAEAGLPLLIYGCGRVQPERPVPFEFDAGGQSGLRVGTVMVGAGGVGVRAHADKTILPTNYSE
jgi:hypothetical protein